MNVPIQIKGMRDLWYEPVVSTAGSAGFDLYAAEDIVLEPMQPTLIPLGFGTVMDESFHARIEARSGMALKGVAVLTGVIDSDYRGEWQVIAMYTGPAPSNRYQDRFKIVAGERVAQAVLRPTLKPMFEQVEELTSSGRGEGGFGSTGQR
jgi:dUTP pyrophosphatase